MFRPVLRFPVCSDVHYTALDLESGEGCFAYDRPGRKGVCHLYMEQEKYRLLQTGETEKNELHIVQLVFVYQKKRTA